jgi:hypothetical protein
MEPVKPLFGTRTFAGRWGPYILFAVGYYVLPPGRPRRIYAWTAVFTIAAIVTTDLDGWDYVAMPGTEGAELWLHGWKAFIGVPTIWTWLFAPAAIYCWVQLFRIIWAIRTGRYFQQPEPVEEHVEYVEEAPAPRPGNQARPGTQAAARSGAASDIQAHHPELHPAPCTQGWRHPLRHADQRPPRSRPPHSPTTRVGLRASPCAGPAPPLPHPIKE